MRNTEITNNIDSNFTITDGNGATYQFPNRHVWNSDGSNPIQWRCPGVNVTDYDVTNSSTGALQLNTTNFPNSATLTLKNGMRLYLPDQNPTPMSVEDTNGNFQSVTAGDTLKRTATFTYSFPDQKITVLDSNGANATYTTVASTSAQPIQTSRARRAAARTIFNTLDPIPMKQQASRSRMVGRTRLPMTPTTEILYK